jgi:quercetin dioxygenase-like cupin family protein
MKAGFAASHGDDDGSQPRGGYQVSQKGQMVAAEAAPFASLLEPPPSGIASRVLARSVGGNVTLFAFDAEQELSEHTSPFEALVVVLDGEIDLTIGGRVVSATAGTITRMPPRVPHAVSARAASRMLLVLLRD